LPNGLLTSPIPPSVVDSVRQVEGVDLVAAMGQARGRLRYPDGATASLFVTSVDRAGVGTLLLPRMAMGRATDLDDHGILVDRLVAKAHHLGVGDRITYAVDDG